MDTTIDFKKIFINSEITPELIMQAAIGGASEEQLLDLKKIKDGNIQIFDDEIIDITNKKRVVCEKISEFLGLSTYLSIYHVEDYGYISQIDFDRYYKTTQAEIDKYIKK